MSRHPNHKVAVIIPSYNRRECLGRALDSVFAQTHLADEVCVVDDGSTDGTKEFVLSNYPTVLYIHQKNAGVSAARNLGVNNTASEWLAFLDSDDEWLPEKLSTQLQVIAAEPTIQLVHSNEIWIRNGVRVNQMNKHQKHGGHIFKHCLPQCAISPSAVILRRDLLLKAGGFDESLPACEDYDLWLKICHQHAVHYIDQPLLKKYGGHDDQLSRQHWGMDRFRVQSLDRLVQTQSLNEENRNLAVSTLLEKTEILLNGARKRDNAELADVCLKLLSKYRP